MRPLSDGIPARRFPIVNVVLIVANFAVWTFYELPQLIEASFGLFSASANGAAWRSSPTSRGSSSACW